MDDLPIIACATGNNENVALALIRISGFKNFNELNPYFSIDLNKLLANKSRYISVLDKSGNILDKIVATYFQAPNSYTGENLLELSVHGNILNVKRIISGFIADKICFPAEKGEFSRRAYLNKKISLTETEGLELFLNAKSPLMLEQGMQALSGKLRSEYEEVYNLFLKVKSGVELSIDFLEDIGEETSNSIFRKNFSEFKEKIEKLHKRASFKIDNFFSPKIVIIGEPNSGKSTLFNFMLEEDRAIVDQMAGTTRDYLSENISINDQTFTLIDTAGVRKSLDSIEQKGIQKVNILRSEAFFKILLINVTDNVDTTNEVYNDRYDLTIFTHSDLKDRFRDGIKKLNLALNFNHVYSFTSKSGSIGPNYENSGSIGPDYENSGSIGPKWKNCKLDSINPRKIKYLIHSKMHGLVKNSPLIIQRHIDKIEEIKFHLSNLSSEIDSDDIAIKSFAINSIGKELEELIGIISPEDILTSIFENFCIGK